MGVTDGNVAEFVWILVEIKAAFCRLISCIPWSLLLDSSHADYLVSIPLYRNEWRFAEFGGGCFYVNKCASFGNYLNTSLQIYSKVASAMKCDVILGSVHL